MPFTAISPNPNQEIQKSRHPRNTKVRPCHVHSRNSQKQRISHHHARHIHLHRHLHPLYLLPPIPTPSNKPIPLRRLHPPRHRAPHPLLLPNSTLPRLSPLDSRLPLLILLPTSRLTYNSDPPPLHRPRVSHLRIFPLPLSPPSTPHTRPAAVNRRMSNHPSPPTPFPPRRPRINPLQRRPTQNSNILLNLTDSSIFALSAHTLRELCDDPGVDDAEAVGVWRIDVDVGVVEGAVRCYVSGSGSILGWITTVRSWDWQRRCPLVRGRLSFAPREQVECGSQFQTAFLSVPFVGVRSVRRVVALGIGHDELFSMPMCGIWVSAPVFVAVLCAISPTFRAAHLFDHPPCLRKSSWL